MAMWEAVNRPRSFDYPFTLIQLQLGPDDEGVGKASIATKITKNDGVIELENFANQPVALNSVEKRHEVVVRLRMSVRQHVDGDGVVAALRDDDVGVALARLDELEVHRLDGRQVLFDDRLAPSARAPRCRAAAAG